MCPFCLTTTVIIAGSTGVGGAGLAALVLGRRRAAQPASPSPSEER